MTQMQSVASGKEARGKGLILPGGQGDHTRAERTPTVSQGCQRWSPARFNLSGHVGPSSGSQGVKERVLGSISDVCVAPRR